MDRQQTVKVLSVLKAAYPHAFKDLTRIDAEAMINLWEMMFSADPYEEVNAAVAALIATRSVGFSPTVGEVKEQLRKLHTKEEIDENSAWVLVSKACRNGSYHSKDEFEKLPEQVKRAVGSADMIKQWASMDAEVVESVVASTFKKAYRVQAERDAEVFKLPPQIKQMLDGNNFKMIEGD